MREYIVDKTDISACWHCLWFKIGWSVSHWFAVWTLFNLDQPRELQHLFMVFLGIVSVARDPRMHMLINCDCIWKSWSRSGQGHWLH